MTTTDGNFTVEARRDGLSLAASEYFGTLFDATLAALDLAKQLGATLSGPAFHVVMTGDGETLLDIKVVPGRPLDA